MLSFVLYRSTPSRRTSQEAVDDILWHAVHKNPREGLTGFLHYDGDVFLQYLEGPPGPLGRKINQIHRDGRHKNFKIVAEGPLETRLFPDWAMGQLDLDNVPASSVLASKPWLFEETPGNIKGLLDAFVDQSRLSTAKKTG